MSKEINISQKALFLDRDGVINHDRGYIFKIDEFDFLDGIFELCKKFIKKNYLIFIITNQSGIARGLYDENDLQKTHTWLSSVFRDKGINITKIYFCPHHPDITGYCDCRKPKPGMIKKACKEFNVDLKNSYFIGDKFSDIQAAKNAGILNRIFLKSSIYPSKEASKIASKIISSLNELI